MNSKVVIVDYGVGNLFSINEACKYLGYTTILSSNPDIILSASNLILPGVGAFEIAINRLKSLNLIEVIKQYVKTGKPLMGVCLGMQLLFDESEEFGSHKGLGLIEGKILKFPEFINQNKLVIPHIGWNSIIKKNLDWAETPLKKTSNNSLMYFVHSYYALPSCESNILTESTYSDFKFCSSVKKDNIYGFQFHPEKSGKDGLNIYNNFLKI
jgi:glutamine amidotransferase